MESLELRVLRYFLAVTEERSITGAAEYLQISQPSLSRQLRQLEERLGHRLFERGSRAITLTDEGELLRERAQEIVALADRTAMEIASMDEPVGGPVYLGCGETDAMRILARAARRVRERWPQVRFHLYSGNAEDLGDRLDSGFLDFAVLIEPADVSKYDYVRLPVTDVWGVLMRRDHPLAEHSVVSSSDLEGLPLLVSRQMRAGGEFAGWRGSVPKRFDIVGTYNLPNNAALMVSEGVGCALCLDRIVNTGPDSDLTFRPLTPRFESGLDLVWRANRTFSRSAHVFLEELRGVITGFGLEGDRGTGDETASDRPPSDSFDTLGGVA